MARAANAAIGRARSHVRLSSAPSAETTSRLYPRRKRLSLLDTVRRSTTKKGSRMSDVPMIMLNNGVEIPQMGLGTYQIAQADARKATLVALEAGYRHIDTAQMYGNEKGVGQAVRDFEADRSDIFVTSKLNNGFHAYDDALKAFDRTLDDLGFEYLDLFLIHWPLAMVSDFVETWRAMEEIARSGLCRAIGVSNFQPHHLQRLIDETEMVPTINQIEIHPYFAQNALRDVNAQHDIATEAWSPIAQGRVLDDPTLAAIGEAHGKSSAQVALRWHIERGDIIFPKSAKPDRMAANMNIFDFELGADEMARIDALDRGQRNGPDPDDFNWIP